MLQQHHSQHLLHQQGRILGPVQRPARLIPKHINAATLTASGSGLGLAAAGEEGLAGRKVAIFVEPSPFSHISGMKNRFESLIKGLREAGDDVMVVTPDRTPPAEFCGARVSTLLQRGGYCRGSEGR